MRRARTAAPWLVAACALLAAGAGTRARHEPARFPLIAVLCYHDLSDDGTAPLQTVPADFLREQIRACRAQGWTFLSLGELLQHREHPEELPPRVMVLTFDDGYRSFVDQALPVLREAGVKATLSPITSFVDHPPAGLPPLLGWDELRALDARREVEIASHTHALHGYEPADPAGDAAPAVTARRWLAAERRYEDREQYRDRIGGDLAASQRVLREHLGHAVATLVWPYGVRNEMAQAQAALAGFRSTLVLESRPVTAADLRAGCLPRVMVTRRLEFGDPSLRWLLSPPAPVRAVDVDLDALWDPDERTFRERLELAATRAKALGATEAILPFAPDPRRDGQFQRAWAMNHQVPPLADVWSMAAGRFRAAGMKTWLRAPTLELTWTWERHPEWRLRTSARTPLAERWSTRLSPEAPGAREAAVDLLTDLAVYLPLDGVLFEGDAAVAAPERLASDSTATPARKAEAIRGLLEDCKRAVRAWRPECRFARALPVAALERRGVDPASAADLDDAFAHDELVVLDPARDMRDLSTPAIERLARRAVSRWRASGRDGAPPVLLLLPARDPGTRAWLPAGRQQAQATAALRLGLVHLGTTPVAAQGELPVGLLDDRPGSPPVRAASKR